MTRTQIVFFKTGSDSGFHSGFHIDIYIPSIDQYGAWFLKKTAKLFKHLTPDEQIKFIGAHRTMINHLQINFKTSFFI